MDALSGNSDTARSQSAGQSSNRITQELLQARRAVSGRRLVIIVEPPAGYISVQMQDTNDARAQRGNRSVGETKTPFPRCKNKKRASCPTIVESGLETCCRVMGSPPAINRDWANRAGRQTFPDTTKADAEHKKLNLAPGRQATIGPGACDQTPSSLDCGRAEFRKKRHKHRPSSKKGQEERNRCISKN